jgi:hypothetical protein
MRKGNGKMPRLWLIFGLVYVLIAVGIFFHHFLSFPAMWQWEEVLHHETFFIGTVWVATAYLFVAIVELIVARKK